MFGTGAKHYVHDEQDGLLVEIDDCDGLVIALDRALNDKALRAKIVKGGQETYKRLFSRDAVIATLIESYKDMIERYAKDKAPKNSRPI
jgi:glycosyltransferase involved in cell wall biosynthesis